MHWHSALRFPKIGTLFLHLRNDMSLCGISHSLIKISLTFEQTIVIFSRCVNFPTWIYGFPIERRRILHMFFTKHKFRDKLEQLRLISIIFITFCFQKSPPKKANTCKILNPIPSYFNPLHIFSPLLFQLSPQTLVTIISTERFVKHFLVRLTRSSLFQDLAAT